MLLPSSDPWQNASPYAVFSLSGWLGMQQRGPCQAHFQDASVARVQGRVEMQHHSQDLFGCQT